MPGDAYPLMPEEMRRNAEAYEAAGSPPGKRDDPAELRRRLDALTAARGHDRDVALAAVNRVTRVRALAGGDPA